MNNNQLYKDAMSGVHHSDDAVEKIFNMTVDKKGSRKGYVYKRIAATALAFAIVLGGGFGVNSIYSKKNDNLSVIIAYAGDNGKLHFDNKSSNQELFFGIYKAPTDDKEACKKVLNRWRTDSQKVNNYTNEKNKDESASYSSSSSACYNKSGEETAVFYTLSGGDIELSLTDYKDVKSFKVQNTSKYGYLLFDYDNGEKYDSDEEYFKAKGINPSEFAASTELQEKILGLKHEYKISGDELRYSQKYGCYEKGFGKYEENKGYALNWQQSYELTEAIGENPNFDLSQIKDTVTFTVEFNDGTTKSASIDMHFDSDGYMHINDQ